MRELYLSQDQFYFLTHLTMFVGKLTVVVQDESYDSAQKKVKAFQKLGRRHGADVQVESFGGDSAPSNDFQNEAVGADDSAAA